MPPVPPGSIAARDWASCKRWTCIGLSPLNRSRIKWLPESEGCPPPPDKGNSKRRTALGESCIKRFSDRGSTPLGSTKTKKEASRLFFILRDLIKGVERSEQNNPVSCFANGDRRILRDVTINLIRNIEQNSRTTPLGSTTHYHVSDKITKIRLIARFLCHKAYSLFRVWRVKMAKFMKKSKFCARAIHQHQNNI